MLRLGSTAAKVCSCSNLKRLSSTMGHSLLSLQHMAASPKA